MIDGRRLLGRTGLLVSPLCIGTSPLASMPHLYGYEVGAEQAIATVRAVLTSPLNFLDTSNAYGAGGESERRIGAAIAREGGLPAGFVVATKVDPDPVTTDFSAARVRESLHESLERLGLERVPLLYLHDPERIGFDAAMGPGGAVRELIALRDEGAVDHIGVACGDVTLALRFIETGAFDVVLTHNRFTLLDRTAEPLLDRAGEFGIGVVNAAPYGGGMLAKGPVDRPLYAYRRDDEDLRARASAYNSICGSFGVSLAAAALHFSMRDARISSTAVGASSSERVLETIRMAQQVIPDDLWPALDAVG